MEREERTVVLLALGEDLHAQLVKKDEDVEDEHEAARDGDDGRAHAGGGAGRGGDGGEDVGGRGLGVHDGRSRCGSQQRAAGISGREEYMAVGAGESRAAGGASRSRWRDHDDSRAIRCARSLGACTPSDDLIQGFSPAPDVACIASQSAFTSSSRLCDRDHGTSMCTAGARFAVIGRVYFYDRRSLSS